MKQVLTVKSKTKIVCVSHEEDADGISSAALIKQAFGGTSILVDYPGMMDSMEPLRNDDQLKELYICLLYTSPSPRDRTRSRMPSSA